jgi:hypothetical protein
MAANCITSYSGSCGGRLVNEAWELHFGYVSGSVCSHKLTLEEGDPLNCLISFFMSRSQQDGPLLGHPLILNGLGPLHNGSCPRLGTSSQSSTTSAMSQAKCCEKKSGEGGSQETQKGLEKPR